MTAATPPPPRDGEVCPSPVCDYPDHDFRPAAPSEPRADREPLPDDGPDYHAEHFAWVSRQPPAEAQQGDENRSGLRVQAPISPSGSSAHTTRRRAYEQRERVAEAQHPYMLADTPAEFERTVRIAAARHQAEAARLVPAETQQDDELRGELARWLAWGYGGDEYADQAGSREHWLEMADLVLALPAMRRMRSAALAARPTTDTETLRDRWRMAEWNALPDDQCGINGCDSGETDRRGPVVMRDGSMHKVCPEHWEPIMRLLGEQASWEKTDGYRPDGSR